MGNLTAKQFCAFIVQPFVLCTKKRLLRKNLFHRWNGANLCKYNDWSIKAQRGYILNLLGREMTRWLYKTLCNDKISQIGAFCELVLANMVEFGEKYIPLAVTNSNWAVTQPLCTGFPPLELVSVDKAQKTWLRIR